MPPCAVTSTFAPANETGGSLSETPGSEMQRRAHAAFFFSSRRRHTRWVRMSWFERVYVELNCVAAQAVTRRESLAKSSPCRADYGHARRIEQTLDCAGSARAQRKESVVVAAIRGHRRRTARESGTSTRAPVCG